MDLVHARVALRERPLLDVVDLSIRFCVANAGAYARLSVAVLVPGLLASFATARLGGWAAGWMAAVALSALVDAPFVALASLQATARSVAPVVFGAAVMLFMAAAIEGFWSASSVPSTVKRLTGATVFVLLTLYIALAGRGAPEDAAEAPRWT